MKSCLLGCGTFLSVISAMILIVGSLNYSGFCWSKMRYLSDEEKFRMRFERVNQQDTIPIETQNKGTQYYEKVKYENFEEFMLMNPDCCAILPGYYELPKPRFIDRITGFNNGEVIAMNYTVYYFDKNGNKKSKKIEARGVLQNCGERKW